MDIFDIIEDATTEANAFESHPGKDLNIEEKVLYIQGISLMMNVDGEIHADEKEYLRILLKSFELPEDQFEDFVAFAKAPDKDTIQAFFRAFRRREISWTVLFDAYQMSRRDGKVEEKEQKLLDHLSQHLEISKSKQDEIYDLFCHIINKDWSDCRTFFAKDSINDKYFKHILDYHEVNLEEILYRKGENLEKGIGLSYKKLDFGKNNIDLNYYDFENYPIRGTHISNHISNKQFSLWLQSLLNTKMVSVEDQKVYNTASQVIIDLSKSSISYSKEQKTFFCEENSLNKDVTGFSILGAEEFAKTFKSQVASSAHEPYWSYLDIHWKSREVIFDTLTNKYRIPNEKSYRHAEDQQECSFEEIQKNSCFRIVRGKSKNKSTKVSSSTSRFLGF